MTTDTTSYNLDWVNQIAHDNDIIVLKSIGLDPNMDGSLQCACPIHKGDNDLGFSYCPRRGIWRCWTQNCHSKLGVGLIALVRGVKNYSIDEACKHILSVTGHIDSDITPEDIERQSFIYKKRLEKKRIEESIEKTFDENLFSNMSIPEYFLEKGYTPEILKQFKAFHCTNGSHLKDRAVLPVYNIHNKVVGFTGRATYNFATIKWLHSPKQFKPGNHLFGINHARDCILDKNMVVLVEGPGDVMRMHEAGITNTVCSFGNKITTNQRKILQNLRVHKVIILFDPDDAGKKGVSQVEKTSRLYFNTHNLTPILSKDPGDMTIEEIQTTIIPEIKKYETN